LAADYRIGRSNCGKASLLRSINDFILRNWGACVDTVFRHVSLDTHLELIKCRLADGAMVTSPQGSYRWRLVPMGERQNMTKSRK